jgi:hypothetical protein
MPSFKFLENLGSSWEDARESVRDELLQFQAELQQALRSIPDASLSANIAQKTGANVFTANQRISKVRPTLELQTPANLPLGRLGQNTAASRVDVSSNLSYDGTNLNADDTAQASAQYTQASGQHSFFTVPAGGNPRTAALVEMLTLKTTGVVSLPIGQLLFPATQNPSSNVNTLDDYEEGNWTPTDQSGAGLTFTVSGATYVKVGKLVHVTFQFAYPATASGANAVVGGLPFLTQTSPPGGVLSEAYTANGANPLFLYVRENSQNFEIYKQTGAFYSVANMSTQTVRGGGFYISAA